MDDVTKSDCLIGGRLISSFRQQVVNPATGQVFARYGVADRTLLDLAVQSALHAFSEWRTKPLSERGAVLLKIATLIQRNATQLAHLLTMEQGKPLEEAKTEVSVTEAIFRHYASSTGKSESELFGMKDPAYYRTYTPLGIVVGIIPWNFPLLIAAMKIAPALLTGNVIIVKPAPTTPLTTLELGRICCAEVPVGVLQILGDDGTVGPNLTDHPLIAKIAFTGSTTTGRLVMEAASKTLKRVSLELGGNDPALVLADMDPQVAAAAIFKAAFTNAGQVCGAVKRVYVHRHNFTAFCSFIAEHVQNVVVGDGLDPTTTLGPVQNAAQYEKATALLSNAVRSGRVIAQSVYPKQDGYFVPATAVSDLPEEHPLVAEEQFAPILPVQIFDRDADAVARANDSPYGLTASVWSSDQGHAERVAHQLDASLVCINRHNENPTGLGLSMTKQSGIGWLLGEEGVKEYLQPHLIVR